MNLSDKEQALYDLIKNKGQITVKEIENELGPKAVGSLGKLLKAEK